MRIWPFIISALLTVGLVILLNTSLKTPSGTLPPLGSFFAPQEGFWQNAEPANQNFSADLQFQELSGRVKVYLDDRLVPHVFADDEADAYFVQGYLHARFRLWQMEFQTHYAAGRLCEILGNQKLPGGMDLLNRVDRYFRRLGLTYAAKVALSCIESNPVTKAECDAYTEGVNAYISTLTTSTLPLEYKLLNYNPEPWTNLKTAILLKYMAYDLAGAESDFPMTNARNLFTAAEFDLLYPPKQDSVDPIIPLGTVLPFKGDTPSIRLRFPAHADSTYLMAKDSSLLPQYDTPDPSNGSNNWAVAGGKTEEGSPILCNDPHLDLTLPSIWYEMQIHTPSFNVYGVSLPGAPGIIIGFNDSSAFGFTNAGRDVRDYYEIKFKDDTHQQYWFNNRWTDATQNVEDIKVKGEPDVMDTVVYTVFGPVMYDPSFPDPLGTGKYYACRWTADDSSNEVLAWNHLDRAANLEDYQESISHLRCPAQNCIFATKTGNIAIWQQGEFPAKWYRQGDFVMPGEDSSYAWQAFIPMDENPHLINPIRGFVSSANQVPVGLRQDFPMGYPYYLSGDFPPYRGMEINRRLESMEDITPEQMEALQTDTYNLFAQMARPLLLKYTDSTSFSSEDKQYYDLVRDWDLRNDPQEIAPSVFSCWWDSLYGAVYDDEFAQTILPLKKPYNSTLLEALLRDSAYRFVDDIRTPQRETLRDIVARVWTEILPRLREADSAGKLNWAAFAPRGINFLLPTLTNAFGFPRLQAGGDWACINAFHDTHGPSWRMVVDLSTPTKAYGIYPGGQSGNPGSAFYDNFVQDWVQGRYYPIWDMEPGQERDARVLWTVNFSKFQ